MRKNYLPLMALLLLAAWRQGRKLKKRGELHTGYYADIVIFDPAAIKANSTYEKPHQLATGPIPAPPRAGQYTGPAIKTDPAIKIKQQ